MKFDDVIRRIIFLPSEFLVKQDKSIYALLKDTGYFDVYDRINEEDFIAILNNHKEAVQDWLNFSEDNRSRDGWYFVKENDKYAVGHFGVNEKNTAHHVFQSDLVACSKFIKKIIESIRLS